MIGEVKWSAQEIIIKNIELILSSDLELRQEIILNTEDTPSTCYWSGPHYNIMYITVYEYTHCCWWRIDEISFQGDKLTLSLSLYMYTHSLINSHTLFLTHSLSSPF